MIMKSDMVVSFKFTVIFVIEEKSKGNEYGGEEGADGKSGKDIGGRDVTGSEEKSTDAAEDKDGEGSLGIVGSECRSEGERGLHRCKGLLVQR
jgi:hypothetical protein